MVTGTKLSQISLAGVAPAATDTVVGVTAANLDTRFNANQLGVSIATTPVIGGSSGSVLFSNANILGGDSGFTYAGSGTATLSTQLNVPAVSGASLQLTASSGDALLKSGNFQLTWNGANNQVQLTTGASLSTFQNFAANALSAGSAWSANPAGFILDTAFGQVSMQVNAWNNHPGVTLDSTASVWWTASTGDAKQGATDTALHRAAAHVVEINNGTAGTGPGVLLTRSTTFANLPGSPVQGMLATITDGLAASCGDGSCTTFGTTVTGGTGALHLQIWYNGTNWTLIGK